MADSEKRCQGQMQSQRQALTGHHMISHHKTSHIQHQSECRRSGVPGKHTDSSPITMIIFTCLLICHTVRIYVFSVLYGDLSTVNYHDLFCIVQRSNFLFLAIDQFSQACLIRIRWQQYVSVNFLVLMHILYLCRRASMYLRTMKHYVYNLLSKTSGYKRQLVLYLKLFCKFEIFFKFL